MWLVTYESMVDGPKKEEERALGHISLAGGTGETKRKTIRKTPELLMEVPHITMSKKT